MESYSSADEYELPTRPFANAGSASINQMKLNALEDRRASKAFSNALTFNKGTRKQQEENHRWLNRFEAFRTHVLRVDPISSPTGKEIERFLSTIVKRVKPRASPLSNTQAVPSYNWLVGGLSKIRKSCTFYYPGFTISDHETSRLESIVDTLYQQGQLTKDPKIVRNWIGATLVRTLAASSFSHALTHGTLNWDVTTMKTTSIVLLAALARRPGDICKSSGDEHDLPYLAWGDITMKLVNGTELKHLQAKIQLRNDKNEKGDASHSKSAVLHTLEESSDNVVCSLKLLLILALRTGNLGFTSIAQVLESMRRHPQKKLTWSYPRRPVVCQLGNQGSEVDVEEPALAHQIARSLQEAALIAGFTDVVHAMDLRRGSARDLAHLPRSEILGVGGEHVGSVLGQSKASELSGLPGLYSGSTTVDTWKLRVNAGFVDPFGLEVTETPYNKREVRLNKIEVDELCQQHSLDPNNPLDRKAACKIAERQRQDQWKASAKEHNLSVSGMLEGSKKRKIMGSENKEYSLRPHKSDADPTLDVNTITLSEVSTKNLASILAGENGEITDDVDCVLFSALHGGDADDALETEDVKFVETFSRINITNNQVFDNVGREEKKARMQVYKGQSKDKVAQFTYFCTNRQFSCAFSTHVRADLRAHEEKCALTSHEAGVKAAEKRAENNNQALKCPQCDTKCRGQKELIRHISHQHNWQPKPCPQGCMPATLYNDKAALDHHLNLKHSGFAPTKCLHSQCNSSFVFDKRRSYFAHLSKVHKIFDIAEKRKHLPKDSYGANSNIKIHVDSMKSPAYLSAGYVVDSADEEDGSVVD